jgi:hypothetical protein
LTYSEFKKALFLTFNITFTPEELGVIILKYDPNKSGCINNRLFLSDFLAISLHEKSKIRKKQVILDKKMNEEKINEISEGDCSRGLVDFEFTEIHKNHAIEKMRECALLVCSYIYVYMYLYIDIVYIHIYIYMYVYINL